jgi:hypothetical protein
VFDTLETDMSTASGAGELEAVCDVCLQLIADGEGNVWVDQNAAHQLYHSPAWPPGQDYDEDDDECDDLGELTPGVQNVPWRTTHTACEVCRWPYLIPVERIRSWQSYLHWSAHLMSKEWLPATDWREFVLRSLEPKRAAVAGLRPSQPQDLTFRGIGS